MKKLTVLLSLLIFLSCKSNKKTLNFDGFSIQVPISWMPIEKQGIDSYVGGIAIDKKDTIGFDVGRGSAYREEEPTLINISNVKYFTKDDLKEANVFIIEDADTLVNPEKFKKNKISWLTIDGRRAKVVQPKKSRIGTTGVYIDSAVWKEDPKTGFSLRGENLAPKNQKELLEAIRTLKFYDNK